METPTTPKPRFWRRVWFWLVVWSALVAAGMFSEQAQEPDFWRYGSEFSNILTTIVAGLLFYFVLALIPSAICVHAWRHRPTGRKVWYVLALAAVTLGLIGYGMQMKSDPGNVDYYSPLFFLNWLWIYSAIALTGLLFLYSLRHFCRWLVSWRIMKRVIIMTLTLAALTTLFYSEENWRGHRAWMQYRQAWEAKGEKFDFRDFVPPPIPDAENVAMAPLLADSFAGRWIATTNREQEALHEAQDRLNLIWWRTNTSQFWSGDFGKWQMGRPIRLQDWQAYYRARFVTNGQFSFMVPVPPAMQRTQPWMLPGMRSTGQAMGSNASTMEITALNTNEFPISERPQTPAADVLLALSRYKPVIAELAQVLQRPQARFPLNYAIENPVEMRLPHLEDLKECATVLQLRACAELQHGQDEKALEDVKLILRLAETIRPEPDWYSFLVRLAIIDRAIQPIWEGLAARQWSEADIKELNRNLQSLDLISEGQAQLRADRSQKIAQLEYERKHRNWTAGWLIGSICPKTSEYLLDKITIPPPPEPARKLFEMLARFIPIESAGELLRLLPPNGWYEWNKASLAMFYQERLLDIADPAKHRIDTQKVINITSMFDPWRETLKISPHDVLIYALLPGTPQYSRRTDSSQNGIDLAEIAGGLELFRMAHGNYPKALTELIPNFLPSLPPDVINGEPLHYHPTPAGSFVLYSVGLNGRDDGGIVVTNQYEGIDFSAGDWVWQYPKP